MPRPRRLVVVLSVLLLASLAGNALLAVALHGAFGKLHLLRIFPLGYVPGAMSASAPATSRPSIAFWGDSRALLWEKAALAGRYTIEEHAHGGITSSQLLLQLRSEAPVRSDIALVQIGINDLHPLGALPAQRDAALAQLRTNLAQIRELLLARSELVVLSTLFPPGPVPLPRRLAWDAQTLQRIDEVNTLLRQAADGRRVLLLDADALLRGPDAWLAPAYADADFFLHVNRAAYERLNRQLLALLATATLPRN